MINFLGQEICNETIILNLILANQDIERHINLI